MSTWSKCDAVIWHGPGHQSQTHCTVLGRHTIHRAVYGRDEQQASWRGKKEVFSGFFNEPPTVKGKDRKS